MINYKHAAVIFDIYSKISTGAELSIDGIERHHKISHKFFEVIRGMANITNAGHASYYFKKHYGKIGSR